MAGAIDPLGQRKNALDAFLETKIAEGFRILGAPVDVVSRPLAPAYADDDDAVERRVGFGGCCPG